MLCLSQFAPENLMVLTPSIDYTQVADNISEADRAIPWLTIHRRTDECHFRNRQRPYWRPCLHCVVMPSPIDIADLPNHCRLLSGGHDQRVLFWNAVSKLPMALPSPTPVWRFTNQGGSNPGPKNPVRAS